MKKIQINGDTFECNVDCIHMPAIERMLKGSADTDKAIQEMSIPRHPIWLRLTILFLRWYRSHVAPKLGNRCVFEPSCSHYSELAFRQKGFIKGIMLTIKRLYRCRPGNGGHDMP